MILLQWEALVGKDMGLAAEASAARVDAGQHRDIQWWRQDISMLQHARPQSEYDLCKRLGRLS